MTRQPLITLTRKDLEVQTFRSGGKGGQHQNKVESGVRIIHKASGAVGESRSVKSQYRNKGLALRHLVATPKFKVWLARIMHEIDSGKTIEQKVDEAMETKNLKIETLDEQGRWVVQK